MASFNLSFVMFIAMMVASSQLYTTMAQTRHVVGDALGWTIPPNGAAAYNTWASQQTFTVGDTLFFNYTNGQHDVAEVSAASYDPCTATNPISLSTTGPTTLTLNASGTHYYICTFTSHCQIGQKLTINVLPSTTASPPQSTTPMMPTSPPPSTTATPPSTTPMSPTSPPPSTTPTPPSMTPTTTPTPPSMTPPTPMTPNEPCPPPASSPSLSPTMPPTGTTDVTAPPLDSGASSLTTIVPATFLAIGLAFLNY